MGGLACYKQLIDNLHALQRQANCTSTSLTMAQFSGGSGFAPTDDDVQETVELTGPLVKHLSKLERRANPSQYAPHDGHSQSDDPDAELKK